MYFQYPVLTLPMFPLSTVNYLKALLVLAIKVSWCWHCSLLWLPTYFVGSNIIFWWYYQILLLVLPIDFISCNIIFYWYYQCFIQCLNAKKYWSYRDNFIGSCNILVAQAMSLGSLQWTMRTQVMLALSTGKTRASSIRFVSI